MVAIWSLYERWIESFWTLLIAEGRRVFNVREPSAVPSPSIKWSMITAEAPAFFRRSKKCCGFSNGYKGERQTTVLSPCADSYSKAEIRSSTLQGGGGSPGKRLRSPSIEMWTLREQSRESFIRIFWSSKILALWVCRINASGGHVVIDLRTLRVTRCFFSAGCQGSVELDMKIVKGVKRLCAQIFSFSADWMYSSPAFF